MMRRFIKNLLKGGADVYNIEKRIVDLKQELEQLGSEVVRIRADSALQVVDLEQQITQLRSDTNNARTEAARNRDVDLYKLGDYFYFVFTDDEAYFANGVSPKNLDASEVAKAIEGRDILAQQRPLGPFDALYESQEIYTCLEMLFLHYMSNTQDFTFVDVGANIGTTCIPAAGFFRRFGRAPKTVSFECTKQTFELLRHNIELNKFNAIIAPINLAVSDMSAKALIFKESGYSGHNRINDPFSDRDYRRTLRAPSEVVTTTTLDKTLADLGISTPIILKIDTEGNEPRVVSGAKGILDKRPTPMVLEFAPTNICKICNPNDFLTEIDQSHFIVEWVPQVKSRKYKVLRHDIPGFIDSVAQNGHGWSDLCCVPRNMDGVDRFMARIAD
jgi:FkbM family methyltransferase